MKPTAQQKPQPEQEPSQVVTAPAPVLEQPAADPLETQVAAFVERVNAAQDAAPTSRPTVQPADPVVAATPSATDPSVRFTPLADPAELRDAGAAGAKPAAGLDERAAMKPPELSVPVVSEPPVLGTVEARPAPSYEVTPITDGTGGVNAPATARTLPTSIREFLEQSAIPRDGTFREQLDLRLAWVLAGDYTRAREPLKMVTVEQQELATRLVAASIAIREAHLGDLAGAANKAAKELDELQATLRKLSDLELPTVQICSAVRGYGQYDVLSPARFVAGVESEFVVYCEVTHFVSQHRDDGYWHAEFDLTTSLVNRAGDVVLELHDPGLADQCRNPRQDCFIPRLVRLPASLSPGRYVAKVTVADKLGQKVAENQAPFELVARP